MLKIDSEGYASVAATDDTPPASGAKADVVVVDADQAWEYQQERGYAPLTLGNGHSSPRSSRTRDTTGSRSSAGSWRSTRGDLRAPDLPPSNAVPCDYEVPIPRKSPVAPPKLVKQKVVHSESEEMHSLESQSAEPEVVSPLPSVLSLGKDGEDEDVFEVDPDGRHSARNTSEEPRTGESHSEPFSCQKTEGSASKVRTSSKSSSKASTSSRSSHRDSVEPQASQQGQASAEHRQQLTVSQSAEAKGPDAGNGTIETGDVERVRASTFTGVKHRQNIERREKRTFSDAVLHISLNQDSGAII